MGDIQQKRQLRGVGFVYEQRRIEHTVVGAVVVEGRQARCLWEIFRQLRRAVVPASTVAAGDPQREICLPAQLIGQFDFAVIRLNVV
ncbi:hypothetical protein D3C86_903270 [compost metagenome]